MIAACSRVLVHALSLKRCSNDTYALRCPQADPNSYALMGLFVDRVRRAPKCFGMQFVAAIWTQDRTHNVVLQINYLGLQLYNLGEAQALLASFRYLDSLVSWLALNDMLTLHVVHKPTKRSAKLHFLTREASQIKSMLTRCILLPPHLLHLCRLTLHVLTVPHTVPCLTDHGLRWPCFARQMQMQSLTSYKRLIRRRPSGRRSKACETRRASPRDAVHRRVRLGARPRPMASRSVHRPSISAVGFCTVVQVIGDR